MKKIIECIPNFSEGRDKKKIQAILNSITAVPGAILLDYESDSSHNRSVVTFAGEPKPVIEAAFQAVKKAAEIIDLDKHKGEHPRMGATDVCPLVPLSGLTEEECVKYAEELGSRIAEELDIPVYLYEKAAKRPERKNLADIRKGEYEEIKKEIAVNPDRAPDFGPKKLGKAGAIAIGVRGPLIAFNVNLESKNLQIAKDIAKKIRFKDGGFKCVKAMGFKLENKNTVQVSMNLTNYKITNIQTVFKAIKKEAKKHGVKILESEIIGLVPQKALIKAVKSLLKIAEFKNDQILEIILQKKTDQNREYLDEFIDKISSKNPFPGGGSVAALASSLAAALSLMVANLTLANKKYESAHADIKKVLTKLQQQSSRLYQLIYEDSKAYKMVRVAIKNKRKIQEAFKKAAKIPFETAQTAIEILDPLLILAKKGNPNAISDCGVALYMTESAVKGAILNIRINLKEITDKKFIEEMEKACGKLKNTLKHKSEKISELVKIKIKKPPSALNKLQK